MMKLILVLLSSIILVSLGFDVDSFSQEFNVKTIERNEGWGVTAVDPDANLVYITNHKKGTVTVFDGKSNEVISENDVGETPFGIGINPKTKTLYIAREQAQVLTIANSGSFEIIKEIKLAQPYDIAVNSKTNTVYITSDRAGMVSVLDGSTNSIVTSFDVADPCGIAVNEKTGMVYVTSESTNKVHVVDGADNSLVTMIDVGKSPRGVISNPETNLVYITNQLDGTISVIDGQKNEVIETIPVGNTPRRVVVNAETNLVYVSNQISNSLSVIDGATNEIVDTIPVRQPFELMINPVTGKIYATYFDSPTLSIVNDPISEQVESEIYEIILTMLGAGVVAFMIAFFIVQKKRKKVYQNDTF